MLCYLCFSRIKFFIDAKPLFSMLQCMYSMVRKGTTIFLVAHFSNGHHHLLPQCTCGHIELNIACAIFLLVSCCIQMIDHGYCMISRECCRQDFRKRNIVHSTKAWSTYRVLLGDIITFLLHVSDVTTRESHGMLQHYY